MTIGIMQPYFMPYIGYFQLMAAVDKYIIYDDVNYIKGGWVARNNLIIGGKKQMFHIELSGASPNKHFNEIFIRDDFRKLRKTLQMNYSKATYYNQAMELMEKVFSYEDKRLSHFIAKSFKQILSYLSIDTELIMSSDLQKDNSLKGKDKVIDICRRIGADTYYNAIGGQELYSKEEFQKHGIELYFVKPQEVPYPQTVTPFVPWLSMIDVLMNNSAEDIRELLKAFEIV